MFFFYRFPWCILAKADGSDRTVIWPEHSEFMIGRIIADWPAGSFKIVDDGIGDISRRHCSLRWIASSESAIPGSSSGGNRVILEDLSSNGARGVGTQVNGKPVPLQDRPPPPPHPGGLMSKRSAAAGSNAGPWRWIELQNGARIALLLRNGLEHHVFNVTLI